MKQPSAEHETIAEDLSATLEPERDTLDDAGRAAISRLGRVHAGELAMGPVLGEGGMGVVHLATQTALGRKVAVKTLRPGKGTQENAMQLLREAWVTGALEHPSVVPVYDLSLDPAGHPVIVLRRVDGTEWAGLMHDPAVIASRFGAADSLAWNLRVLMQLCNAVHFGHQRGILHRDLKPDNVMLGDLGEVYLLDWGIAVAMDDDGTGRMPLREHAREPAGTPAYMAPEMWLGEPAKLTERTDVYLLGSILYEILSGQPPHHAKTLTEMRMKSLVPPSWPEGPAPLVAICQRCLAHEPSARIESALALRRALEDYLAQDETLRLIAVADQRLVALRAALAAKDPVRSELYDLFGACRFGYELALSRSPDMPAARVGLRDAIAAMATYEVDAGDPRAAETLLSPVTDPPSALLEKIAATKAMLAKQEADRRALETVGRDWNEEVGRRTRRFVGVVAGLIWTILPIIGHVTGKTPTTYRGHAINSVAFLVGALLILAWGRESIFATRFNRGMVLGALVWTPLCQLAQVLLCWLVGIPATLLPLLNFSLWFALFGVFAAMVDVRFLVASAGYFAAMVVTARWPTMRPAMMSIANLVLAANVVLVWGPVRLPTRASPR